jgi:integrase
MADNRVRLTLKRISDFPHPAEGKAFLWDTEAPTLAVLASPKRKNYIFESRLNGKTLRITIGDVNTFTLESARIEANRLKALVNQGIDPREQKRQIIEEQEAAKIARQEEEALKQAQGALIADIWEEYLAARTPKWGERHLRDHRKLSQDGITERRKGGGLRKPGPLAPLLRLPLHDRTADVVEKWMEREAADRPTQSRLALRLLQSFLNWCNEQPLYQGAVNPGAITRQVKEALPKKQAKTDCLQKEQLAGWFTGVRQIDNPVVSAFLQGLLLTGARKEELAGLKWEDVDFRWKSLTIRDKIEGQRIIPLTPYVESLLKWLPKRNEWVFSSPAAASGRLQEPFKAHNRALAVAGIDHLSLHGLRRSFGSLSEWVELPVGIVAQIMGHKPSATAERHYRVRPLDLLRKWHVKLEEWILEQAGLSAPVAEQEKALKVVGE